MPIQPHVNTRLNEIFYMIIIHNWLLLECYPKVCQGDKEHHNH
jgi:hypothetical protein